MGQKALIFRLLVWLTCYVTCQSAKLDPCERQSFKLKCTNPSNPSEVVRSQFVLRYYRRSSECVSYPFGHCPGDTLEPTLFRYKSECEQNCLNQPGHGPSGLIDFGSSPSEFESHPVTAPIFTPGQTALNSGLVVVPTAQTSGVRKTKCQHERETALAKEAVQQRGTYIPDCDKVGSFEALQCHERSGYCWCVNHDGVELRGTRTPPGNPKPDCTGQGLSSRVFMTPTRPTYATKFGFATDDNNTQHVDITPTEHANTPAATVAAVAPTAVVKYQCDIPVDPGSCDNWEIRWHYDDKTRQCAEFHFGGCLGNGNNFATRDECEQHCIPAEIRNCPNNSTALLDSLGEKYRCEINNCPDGYKCTFTPYAAICCPHNEAETKVLAGDLTVSNSSEEVCMAEKERGDCEKFELRFYYSPNDDSCKYFFYGGCGGNKNNFKSVEECRKTCVKKSSNDTISKAKVNETSSPLDFDPLPSKSSPIPSGRPTDLSNLPVWTPIKPTPQESTISVATLAQTPSAEFNFGPPSLPSGNPITPQRGPFAPILENNNLAAQTAIVADICQMPQDPGPCTQFVQQWFFNTKTKSCEQFIYGGCKGNGNIFATQELCMAACGDLPNPCQHPLDKGPCLGSFPRWFYNGRSNNCEQFAYSGCGGNGNNFGLKADCEQQCRIGFINVNSNLQPNLPGSQLHPGDKPIFLAESTTSASVVTTTTSNISITPASIKATGFVPSQLPSVSTLSCAKPVACDNSCRTSIDQFGCQFCDCPSLNVLGSGSATPPPADGCVPVDKISCANGCLIVSTPNGCKSCLCSTENPKISTTPFVPSATSQVQSSSTTASSQQQQQQRQTAAGTNESSPPSSRPTGTGSPPSIRPPSTFQPIEQATSRGYPEAKQLEPTRPTQGYPEAKQSEPTRPTQGYQEAKQSESTRPTQSYQEAKQSEPTRQPTQNYPETKRTEQTRPTQSYAETYRETSSSQQRSSYEAEPTRPTPVQTEPTRQGYNNEWKQQSSPQPPTSWTTEQSRPPPSQPNKSNYNEVRPQTSDPLPSSWETQPNRPAYLERPEQPVKPTADNNGPQRKNESDSNFIIPGPDPCKLRPDPGQCQDSIKRWHYNPSTGQCQSFQYTGCAGNLNNFEILETCVARCVSASASFGLRIPPICSAPRDPGPCGGYNIRYYFNLKNLHCEQFVYGGCGGNKNQFKNLAECERSCPALDPRTSPNVDLQGQSDGQFGGYSAPPDTSIHPDIVFPTNYAPPTYQPPGDYKLPQQAHTIPPLRTDWGNAGFQQYPPGYGPIPPLSVQPTANSYTSAYTQPAIHPPTDGYTDTSLNSGNLLRPQVQPGYETSLNSGNFVKPPSQPGYDTSLNAGNLQFKPLQSSFDTKPSNKQNSNGWRYGAESAYNPVPTQSSYGQQPQNSYSQQPQNSYSQQPQNSYSQQPVVYGSPTLPTYQQPPINNETTYGAPQPQWQSGYQLAHNVVPTQSYQPIQTKGYGPPSFEPSPLPKTVINQQGSYSPANTFVPSANTNYAAVQPSSYGAEPPKRTPTCPNGNEPRKYNDGRPVLCLPGKDQCPPDSSCNFNGIDYFCCPNSEDLGDFGLGYQSQTGYGGAKPQIEQQNGYGGPVKSSIPNELPYQRYYAKDAATNISRIKRQDQFRIGVGDFLPLPTVNVTKRQVPGGNGTIELDSLGSPPGISPPPTGQFGQFGPPGTNGPPSNYGPPSVISDNYQPPQQFQPQQQQPYQQGSSGECTAPRDSGSCHGNHMRWYYDTVKDICSLFYYGGCQGNSNNFKTQIDCETTCIRTRSKVGSTVVLCPGGAQPFATERENPASCGAAANGLDCPTGYTCTTGRICCPEPAGPPTTPSQYLPGGVGKLSTGPTISPYLFYQQQYQQYQQSRPQQQQQRPLQIVSLPRSQQFQQGFIQSYQTDGTSRTSAPVLQATNDGISIDNSGPTLSSAYNRNQQIHKFGTETKEKVSGLTDRSPFIQMPAGLPPMVFRMPQRFTLPEGAPIQQQQQFASQRQFTQQFTQPTDQTLSSPSGGGQQFKGEPQEPKVIKLISSAGCHEPMIEGRECHADDTNFLSKGLQYFFNETEGRCRPFMFNGCDGNNNRFTTKEKCNEVCLGNPNAN